MATTRSTGGSTVPGRLALCAAGLLAACGGDGAPAAEGGGGGAAAAERPAERASASEPRLEGRTLAEHAVGLEDLSADVRKRAMESVLRFGEDARPLAERMRRMAVEDPDDELRAAACVALVRMADPGAATFLLERLRDPAAAQADRGWRMLLQVVVHDVEAGTLDRAARALARAAPAHGERLLAVSASGVPGADGLRRALAETLLDEPHADATVALLLPMLPDLDVAPAARVAWVRANHARLAGPDRALDVLRVLGTADAFDAALAILDETGAPLGARVATIQGFPAEGAPGGRKLDALAALVPGAADADLQRVLSAMEDVAANGGDPEGPARYAAVLTDLAETGGTPDARAVALLFLGDGVAAGTLGADGLDPLFAVLAEDGEEVVLGTALAALKQLAPRAPDAVLDALPGRLAAAAWARDVDDEWSHAVADGVLQAFSAGLGRVDPTASIAALAAQADAHPGHRANFQLLQWLAPQSGRLKQLGADMPAAAALCGRLLVDGAIGPAEADWLYRSANLTSFNNVTRADVETIAAFYEPLMLAERLPDGQFFRGQRGTAIQVLTHVRDEGARERYLEFAWRMTREASPAGRVAALDGLDYWHFGAFNPSARRGLAHFEHALAGRTARIHPTVFRSRTRSPQVVSPAPFVTGAEGEAFLLTRLETSPPSLGSVANLADPLVAAFLDADGSVIALGRTDDEGAVAGRGRAARLTHPEARHALLFAEGAFDLAVGDSTGLDPAFLAEL